MPDSAVSPCAASDVVFCLTFEGPQATPFGFDAVSASKASADVVRDPLDSSNHVLRVSLVQATESRGLYAYKILDANTRYLAEYRFQVHTSAVDYAMVGGFMYAYNPAAGSPLAVVSESGGVTLTTNPGTMTLAATAGPAWHLAQVELRGAKAGRISIDGTQAFDGVVSGGGAALHFFVGATWLSMGSGAFEVWFDDVVIHRR